MENSLWNRNRFPHNRNLILTALENTSGIFELEWQQKVQTSHLTPSPLTTINSDCKLKAAAEGVY